jgi:hypothetical protein
MTDQRIGELAAIGIASVVCTLAIRAIRAFIAFLRRRRDP